MPTIDWGLIQETLIKWAIPVIAAAIIGFIVKHLIDPREKDRQHGEASRLQDEWDEAARHSEVLNEKCAVQIAKMDEEIKNKFKEAKAESSSMDEKILAAVEQLQVSINSINEELKKQKETSNLLQRGVLDMHLQNLIETCKVYIARGYITPVEVMQYNERLQLYYQLGGNGHMKPWNERINALPIHEHSEQ